MTDQTTWLELSADSLNKVMFDDIWAEIGAQLSFETGSDRLRMDIKLEGHGVIDILAGEMLVISVQGFHAWLARFSKAKPLRNQLNVVNLAAPYMRQDGGF